MISPLVQYNGIALADEWPPRSIDKDSREPLPVAYLESPPDLIPIDGGRQLFVDDFLVASTTLKRTYHAAKKHPAAPVLVPETDVELNGGNCPVAAPFNDGVWYDPAEDRFKLWYQAGWFDGTALATSRDGLHWERPALPIVPGTNLVIPRRKGHRRDGSLVWLDHEAREAERYKMFLFNRWDECSGGEIYTSADGVHWCARGRVSECGDNSSFFYNPFRECYVFSIRQGWPFRARAYHEHADFFSAARWAHDELVAWARADVFDVPEPLIGDEVQLYDVNAVAYESIIVGSLALLYGPQNEVCARIGQPKFNDLQLAYSRDGFHWHRPQRTAFIPCSRKQGTWDYGYIHAAGGVGLVIGDELWFYYGAWSGESERLEKGRTGAFRQSNLMYAGGSTGLAVLRRDGFASFGGDGSLTTRVVKFSGRYLFVNVDAPRGELRVEIFDPTGRVRSPFTADSCRPIQTDKTCQQVVWQDGDDLSVLSDRPVVFRFHVRGGELYSFWVSPYRSGVSGGYIGAGGPGFSSGRDL